jgi:flagellar motor switch protein FliG
VLAYLPADSGATVMSMLPEELQAEVAMRVAVMDRTAPEVIREVEEVMERKLASVINQELATAGGVKSLVDILNYVDTTTERNIIGALGERDSELAEDVRKLMFTFEDLMLLDDKGIQQVLKDIEMKDVGLALKGGAEEIRDKIFGNMSSRAAQMLKEDMEFMGPVRRRVIEEAQGKVVAVVRRLEDSGKITIQRGGAGAEDELIG